MRRLCHGGSFNPIHCGHLRVSRAVAERLGFDRVVLIPSAQPPHKPTAPDMAPAEERLAMCRLVSADDPLYETDDIELRRDRSSYTIDTARELRRRPGWGEVYWLIGADQVAKLPTWHDPSALLAEVRFVVVARPGWAFDWGELPEPFQVLREHVVEAPLVDISATDIRRRVAAGEPIAGLVPPPVADYIRAHGLYRR